MEVFVMGNYDDEDYVYCKNCEKEILQENAIYVGGKPYCKKCYRDAEAYETIDVYNEEEDEDDEFDDDDDDDDDNDDYD
jgi:formylmethanofuran dehydrogenase subunit E